MSLLILCLATVGIVAVATSAMVVVLVALLKTRINRLAPSAQARVYMAAALLPLVSSVLVLGAALAPSFGWIRDHYVGEVHSHPHLCAAHELSEWPSIPLIALALLVTGRLLQTLMRTSRALWLSQRALRSMKQASQLDEEGLRVLPTSEPQAFVVGLLRPQIYATRGLVSGASRAHLPAVMAHENAHLDRRDPLRKFLARVGLQLHIPGLSRHIEVAHERALEMAADEEAAKTLGSRTAVASALVALAKARVRVPNLACGAAGSQAASEIERRVVHLINHSEHRDWPTRSAFALFATSAAVLIALAADTVHHEVEFLLGFFGS